MPKKSILIRVKPGSREEAVEELDDGGLRVTVKAPPEKGQANRAVIKLLAKHYHVPQSAVRIAAGHRTRNKLVQISS